MTHDELRKGEGLRQSRHLSMAGVLQYPRAPRLDLPQGLFWSDVDLADVSFYQGKIDFAKMKASGIKGVIIRAGQNVWVDKRFVENWQAAKEAGLPRGSYWFYDSRADPKAQADLYRQTLGDDLGELPLVADYEENYNGAYKGWRNLYNFLERLKSTGAKLSWDKVWIYTGYWYWMANSPQNDAAALNYFSHYKLWLAYYTINPANVRIPKPWADKTVKTWQWGTPTEGIERGVETTEIDMNKFTGTLDDFNTFFGLSETPTPPTGEIPMSDTWKVTWNGGANRRPAPSTNNNPVPPPLNNGEEFVVVEYSIPNGKTQEQEYWGKLTGGLWVALTYNSEPRALKLTTTPPPTGDLQVGLSITVNQQLAELKVNGETWKKA